MRIKVIPHTMAALLFFSILAGGCQNQYHSESDREYVNLIETWRQTRLERLRSPDSWLSLAGLYWLEQETNSFGTDESNDFVIHKEGIPDHVGIFLLKAKTVVFSSFGEIDVFHKNRVVSDIKMEDDSSGNPTVLSCKSLSWYVIRRGNRLGIRLKDSRHPRLNKLRGIESFSIDKTWRVKARLERFNEPQFIEVPTVLGTVESQPCPGVLVFQIQANTYRLYPTSENGDLFVIFGDQTNTRETYGGGRFLLVKKPDQRGRTWLDFNRAINPPCVFSPFATCPLPPEVNRLPFRVTAGEKMVRGFGH